MKRLTSKQINFLLLAAQMVVILSVWRLLPPEIPLFYSRPWGKDQLVIFPGILLLPLISFFVFLANLMISRAASQEEKLIKKTLTTASLLFASLSLIALVQIVRLIL
jgi:hypothetical protein